MPKALYVFGGLPGSGKTTLARMLAKHLSATYIRIDTIEQALNRNAKIHSMDEAGYLIAYDVAAENLRLGLNVVADSVNSIDITRSAWRDIALGNQAGLYEFEIICSDENEHRRRVENRKPDIPGHNLPSWQDVMRREYEPWPLAKAIDTSHRSIEDSFETLKHLIP